LAALRNGVIENFAVYQQNHRTTQTHNVTTQAAYFTVNKIALVNSINKNI